MVVIVSDVTANISVTVDTYTVHYTVLINSFATKYFFEGTPLQCIVSVSPLECNML